jgi:hypothetical protein
LAVAHFLKDIAPAIRVGDTIAIQARLERPTGESPEPLLLPDTAKETPQ